MTALLHDFVSHEILEKRYYSIDLCVGDYVYVKKYKYHAIVRSRFIDDRICNSIIEDENIVHLSVERVELPEIFSEKK